MSLKADGAEFRPLCPDAVPGCFLGVLRHPFLQVGLSGLVRTMRLSDAKVGRCKVGPLIGGRHVNDFHSLKARARRFDVEQNRRLSCQDATPELLVGREQQMLIERIRTNLDLDPFATAGDDGENSAAGGGSPTYSDAAETYASRLRILP
ncbi:hypothetical protein GGE24_003263 [Bradyrhizobium centrosematis]|nr:hypothetical protein [Bradyrhizobium centrosematis]MCS3773951.1 hypothetical protein [Bradyrhizobium centrosematis]